MRYVLITLLIAVSALSFSEKNGQRLYAYANSGQWIMDRYAAGTNEENRRGCCSHHGGVCGCVGGRAQCCDGSLSPSCGCD